MDPRIDLTGQTALVTSASCGIGLAIARALLACGAEIVGIGTRISQAAADPASDIAALGPGNTPMDADFSDRSQIAALVKMLEAAPSTSSPTTPVSSDAPSPNSTLTPTGTR